MAKEKLFKNETEFGISKRENLKFKECPFYEEEGDDMPLCEDCPDFPSCQIVCNNLELREDLMSSCIKRKEDCPVCDTCLTMYDCKHDDSPCGGKCEFCRIAFV